MADPSDLPRDYRKAIKIAVALVAIFGPPFFYVYGLERLLKDHLAEVAVKRQVMDDYVLEERAARCSATRNTYKLCVKAGIDCEPVSATCAK